MSVLTLTDFQSFACMSVGRLIASQTVVYEGSIEEDHRLS